MQAVREIRGSHRELVFRHLGDRVDPVKCVEQDALLKVRKNESESFFSKELETVDGAHLWSAQELELLMPSP